MKKIGIILSIVVILVIVVALYAYNTYEEIELTKENFYDYFYRFENNLYDVGEKIDDFTFAENDNDDYCLSAQFMLKKDAKEDCFFENVKIEVSINLYDGLKEVDSTCVPDWSCTLTFKLHYLTGATEGGKGADYYIGPRLTMYLLSYFDKSGVDVRETQYEIPPLVFDDKWSTNYYREIKIVSVSGIVKKGGFVSLNEYRC